MKKIIVILFVSLKIFSCEHPEFKISNYHTSYKKQITEIAFKDLCSLFSSGVVAKGLMSQESFVSESKKAFEAVLDDPNKLKKVLMCSQKVAGFIEFCKSRELTLESLKPMIESQGLIFNEEQIIASMPNIKRTNSECEEFALVEVLAVSKDFRGRGHGKALLKAALDEIKLSWPYMKTVKLGVNESNEIAKKLYEKEGFATSKVQPLHFGRMGVVQYEKSL